MSFAAQRESWMTCMYVRLLGPCFKTGGKPSSKHTHRPDRGSAPHLAHEPRRQNPGPFPPQDARARKPKRPSVDAVPESPPQPCRTQRRTAGSYPYRRLSTSREVPFTLDGFHALLAPQTRCFSAFPYGTCLLSVTSLSYLALEGQHPPYSASSFKLTYSRTSPSPAQPARSRVTPCAPGSQPVCCKPNRCEANP